MVQLYVMYNVKIARSWVQGQPKLHVRIYLNKTHTHAYMYAIMDTGVHLNEDASWQNRCDLTWPLWKTGFKFYSCVCVSVCVYTCEYMYTFKTCCPCEFRKQHYKVISLLFPERLSEAFQIVALLCLMISFVFMCKAEPPVFGEWSHQCIIPLAFSGQQLS